MRTELPSGWESAELGCLAQLINGDRGDSYPTKSSFVSDGVPFINAGHLNDGEITSTEMNYITLSAFQALRSGQVREDDILFCLRGSLGKVGLVKGIEKGAIASSLVIVRPIAQAHPRFLLYFLRSPLANKEIDKHNNGSAQPNLASKSLAKFVVPVAPIEEQKRIAEKLDTVLTRVDAVNTRLARVAPLLKRFRQSVLAAATSGRLTEDWRHQRGKQWSPTLKKVSDIGDVVTGNTPSKKIDDAFGGQWLFVKPGDLDLGYRVLDTSEKLTDLGAGMSRVLPELTVLVTCIGATIGKTGLLRRSGATNQQINAVVCKGTVLPEWLYFWFSSPIGQSAVIENSSATTLPILNKSRFSALELEIPSIDEQTEIARRVETLFAFADRLEARLAQAQTAATRLTPALLAKAFRGELVPQDPNDEPAAELLRRLQAERASAPKASTGRGRKAAVQV